MRILVVKKKKKEVKGNLSLKEIMSLHRLDVMICRTFIGMHAFIAFFPPMPSTLTGAKTAVYWYST